MVDQNASDRLRSDGGSPQEAARAALERAANHLHNEDDHSALAEMRRAMSIADQLSNIDMLANAAHKPGPMNRLEDAISVYDDLVHHFGEREEPAVLEQVAKALVNKGLTLKQLKRHEDAIRSYDEVVQCFGEREEPPLLKQVARALGNKGASLGQMGRIKDKIAAYDELVRCFGDRKELLLLELVAQALLCKAATLTDVKQQEDAIRAYDEVIRRFGNREEPALLKLVASAAFDLGAIHSQREESEEARSNYSLAISLRSRGAKDDTVAEAALIRGDIHRQRDETVKAFSDYTLAITLHGAGAAPNVVAAAALKRGVIYKRREEIDKALADFSLAISLRDKGARPNVVARAAFYRGNIHRQREDVEAAFSDYTLAITLHGAGAAPDVVVAAALKRGMIYERREEIDKALADFSLAISLRDKGARPGVVAAAALRRGSIHYDREKIKEAFSDCTLAISLRDKGARPGVVAGAAFYRGVIHTQREEIEKALSDYTLAISLHGRGAQPCVVAAAALRRGSIHHQREEIEEARSDYTLVIALQDEGADADDVATAAGNLAICDLDRGKTEEAIDMSTLAIGLHGKGAPPNVVAIAALVRGICYAQSGDNEKAISDWSFVISLHKKGVEDERVARAALDRGLLHAKSSNYDAAHRDADFIESELGPELPYAKAMAHHLRSRIHTMSEEAEIAEKHAALAFELCPESSLGFKCECAELKASTMSSPGRTREALNFLLRWADRVIEICDAPEAAEKTSAAAFDEKVLNLEGHFDAIAKFWRAIAEGEAKQEYTDEELKEWQFRSLWIRDLPKARSLVNSCLGRSAIRSAPASVTSEPNASPCTTEKPRPKESAIATGAMSVPELACSPVNAGASATGTLPGTSYESKALRPEDLKTIARNLTPDTVILVVSIENDSLWVTPLEQEDSELVCRHSFVVASRRERSRIWLLMDVHRLLVETILDMHRLLVETAPADPIFAKRALGLLKDYAATCERYKLDRRIVATILEVRAWLLYVAQGLAEKAQQVWEQAENCYEQETDRKRCHEIRDKSNQPGWTNEEVKKGFLFLGWEPMRTATELLGPELFEIFNFSQRLSELVSKKDVVLVTNREVHDLPWTYVLAEYATSVTRCYSLKVLALQYEAAEKQRPMKGKHSLCYFAAPSGDAKVGSLSQAESLRQKLLEKNEAEKSFSTIEVFDDKGPFATVASFRDKHNARNVLMLAAHGFVSRSYGQELASGWLLEPESGSENRILTLDDLTANNNFDFSCLRDMVLITCNQALSGMWAGGSYMRGMYPALCRCGAVSVTSFAAPLPADMIEPFGMTYSQLLAEKLTTWEPAPRARALMETIKKLRADGENPFGLAWWVHDGVL